MSLLTMSDMVNNMLKTIISIGLLTLSAMSQAQVYINDVYVMENDQPGYVMNCNKDEVASYIREGMSRRAIEMICSANAPDKDELNESTCCCITLLESTSNIHVYSTDKHRNKTKWDIIGEDRRITNVSQCGTTLYKGFYVRERSRCANTVQCTGR